MAQREARGALGRLLGSPCPTHRDEDHADDDAERIEGHRETAARFAEDAGHVQEPEHGQHGPGLMLCTDGVTSHLDDASLGALLGRGTAPDACCRDVVAETYRAGAKDNLTVLVADLGTT